MAHKDYYQILDISRSASDEEIKKAYRKKAMQFHPDKNPGDKKAEEQFKSITEAYQVLSDTAKRRQYDQFGSSEDLFGHATGGFRSQRDFGPDMHEAFGDIFGDLFGQSQRRARKGADLRYTLRLSLEEAAKGVDKTIHFMRHRQGQSVEAKLVVKVPAGVLADQKLRLAGEGDDAGVGSRTGDLYVHIELLEHPLFRLDHQDIVLDLPISFVEALKGAEVEIPTLTSKVALKIPPGTTSGGVLRLKNKGYPRPHGAGFGDKRIRVLVDVPTQLTEAEHKALMELAQGLGDPPKVKEFKERVKQVLNNRP